MIHKPRPGWASPPKSCIYPDYAKLQAELFKVRQELEEVKRQLVIFQMLEKRPPGESPWGARGKEADDGK